MYESLIITGASSSYESSLLALIGSLNCNWPNHPPVLVYDLGMGNDILNKLNNSNIEVRKIPEFCPHWRTDFTWKTWCFKDAPAEYYLWIDAGICVLRPLEETFISMNKLGYFCVALYNHAVLSSVPKPLILNSGLKLVDIEQMVSISSGIHGFRKVGQGKKLVDEAYELALNHENMKATEPPHRHDQALLTLLLYKYFNTPLLADYHIYAFHDPCVQTSRQKIWVHRRKMIKEDKIYFSRYISKPGPRYSPTRRIGRPPKPGLIKKIRIAIAKFRGRYPGEDRVGIDKTILHGVKD